jgi:hypothetical protein
VIDASQPIPKIFRELQRQISKLQMRRLQGRRRSAAKPKTAAARVKPNGKAQA